MRRPWRHEKHDSSRKKQGKEEREGGQERSRTSVHAGPSKAGSDGKSTRNPRIADPVHGSVGQPTVDGMRGSSATLAAAVALPKDEPRGKTDGLRGDTVRPPKVGRQRPQSAGAAAAPASAWNASNIGRGGRESLSPAAAAPKESSNRVDGGHPPRRNGGDAKDTAARRVVGWADEELWGARPPPLGKTNAAGIKSFKVRRLCQCVFAFLKAALKKAVSLQGRSIPSRGGGEMMSRPWPSTVIVRQEINASATIM